MRVFNIVVSFVIVSLNIYVSFNHTLELFRAGGFSQNGLFDFLAIDFAAVIAAELVFLMGCVNIVSARVRGIPAGYPAYLTGLLGVSLIVWSNVYTHLNHGAIGVILGVCVPLGIVFSELMFTHAISGGSNTKQTHTHNHKAPHTHDEESTQRESWKQKFTQHIQKLKDSQEAHTLDHTSSHTQDTTHTEQEHENEATHTNTNSHNTQAENSQTHDHIDKQEGLTITHTDSYKATQAHKAKRKAKNHTQSLTRTNNDTQSSHSQNKDSHTTNREVATHTALKWKEREGKFPSIRTLAEEANVSDWTARKVLQELKKKVS